LKEAMKKAIYINPEDVDIDKEEKKMLAEDNKVNVKLSLCLTN
jgi:hypothetical protein